MLGYKGQSTEPADDGIEPEPESEADVEESEAAPDEPTVLAVAATRSVHPLDDVARDLGSRTPAIFEHLYGLMADRMFRLALRMLGDFHEAQDAVQQAFLELARTDELPAEGRSLQAWLYASVRFNCLDIQRYRGRRPAVPFAQIPETVNEPPDYDLGLDPSLEAALALLTPDQRLVIHLKHVEGLDGNEIAEVIGSTRAAVYAMAGRAERRLRHYLELRGKSGRPA
ncbi:MAG: RNA polymerase sigma factor [Actinomycetota bacterium]